MTSEISKTTKMGRPAYDRMKIVADFIEWARSNPDAWTVPQFATSIGINSGMMNEWAAIDDDFSRLFILGKELIGINRLKATMPQPGQDKPLMDRGIYLKAVGNFDRDIHIYDRGERKFDIECKSNIEKETKIPGYEDIVSRLNKTLSQVSDLQSSVNKAKSNINKEEKS